MVFPRHNYLTKDQILDILASFEPTRAIAIVRLIYKNKQEIRQPESMSVESLRSLILESMENEHQPGRDIEVEIPKLGKKLIGHHDGVYWLEPIT